MQQALRHFYEFGPFRLDPQKHRLLRNGEILPLSPKALDALLVLVRNPGKLMERDVLMQAVWADTFVEDANLTVAISHLRKTLGQNGETAEYVETVPRVGYRFVADVREIHEEPTSLIIEKRTLSRTVIEEEEISAAPHTHEGSRSVVGLPVTKFLPFSLSPRAAVSVLTVVVLPLLVAAAFFFFKSEEPRATVNTEAIKSIRNIAVLPPKPLHDQEENAPLSLGLADALIKRLGSVRRIPVRPTSSIVRYAGSNEDPVIAGKALGVDAVLDGTIQRENNGVRVTLKLIKVADGSILWSSAFAETSADIFKLQDALFKQVATVLFTDLSQEDYALFATRRTTNSEAYALFLKGNYFWSKRGDQASKAPDYLRSAIELDPNLAQAYVVLAAVVSTMGNQTAEADALIEKAIQLDSTLADAHATNGFIRMFRHWDWTTTEMELDRSIELDPNSANAHHWKGVYLSLRGRLDEAKVEMSRALELDPLSLIVMADLGQLHYFDHQYDAAIDYCNRALALDGSFGAAHEYLADIYRMKQMENEAFNAWLKRRYPDVGSATERPRRLFARQGMRGVISDELDQQLQAGNGLSIAIARNQAILGNDDDALSTLERAFSEPRTHWLPYINVDPVYQGLRADPRFQALLKRMNL